MDHKADRSTVLHDELVTSMRLMGITDISQLNEFSVNASALENELPRKVNLGITDKITSKL